MGRDPNGTQLQEPLSRIRAEMRRAFADAGEEVGDGNQDALHRSYWRFLLTIGDGCPTKTLTERMGALSNPLREIGEGPVWYRHEFPHTKEAQRTFVPEDTQDGQAKPLYGPEAQDRAGG